MPKREPSAEPVDFCTSQGNKNPSDREGRFSDSTRGCRNSFSKAHVSMPGTAMVPTVGVSGVSTLRTIAVPRVSKNPTRANCDTLHFINFVSARTNKRHHHHNPAPIVIF